MIKFLGKTWVGWINILCLQWMFIRLYYGEEWGVLFPIIPLTGWTTDYLPSNYKIIPLLRNRRKV